MEESPDFLVQSPITTAPESLPSPGAQANLIPSPLQTDMSFALSTAPNMSTTAQSQARRRRPSKGSSSAGIKRSISSPNVRTLSTPSDSAAALAEKRRNKLGYHRTSVACVHCRRRKIRCLLAPDDPQNRCSNCIRLKKECNFYPVDQQPPVERQHRRAGSRPEGMPADSSTASSSSSPNAAVGHVVDQVDHYPMMHVASHPFSGPVNPDGATAMSYAPLEARAFDFPERSSTWGPQYMDHNPLPTGAIMPDGHAYWKGPVLETAFVSFSAPPNAHLPRATTFGPSFTSTSQEPWQPMHHPSTNPQINPHSHPPQPLRSLSYNHIDDHNTYSSPQSTHGAFYEHRPPPSLHASTGSPATTISLSDASSMPSQPHPMTHYHIQGWPGIEHSNKTLEFGMGNGGWYPEPGALAKVQEEGQDGWPESIPGYHGHH